MNAQLPSLTELFALQGKVAIVTGGSRGLGLEMAEGLGEAGARLVITARREPDLRDAEAHLLQKGFEVLAVEGSVADPNAVAALVAATRARYGRIDILVNNAGTTWGAPTLEMPFERWQYVMDTNLNGTWLLSQAVCRVMVEQGEGGRIINVASVAGMRGGLPDALSAIGYSTSKAAVIGLTRTLSTSMALHGILVNAICPGFFPTRMTKGILAAAGEEIGKSVPLGRIGRPGELKGVAVFLAAPASAYVTGQILPVDGGTTA
ncbi:MAG: SDR family oxidoreductase [Thermaerobacter sp.]|nr:SDR family oxidoreductase [Thermaerobacter sp.]